MRRVVAGHLEDAHELQTGSDALVDQTAQHRHQRKREKHQLGHEADEMQQHTHARHHGQQRIGDEYGQKPRRKNDERDEAVAQAPPHTAHAARQAAVHAPRGLLTPVEQVACHDDRADKGDARCQPEQDEGLVPALLAGEVGPCAGQVVRLRHQAGPFLFVVGSRAPILQPSCRRHLARPRFPQTRLHLRPRGGQRRSRRLPAPARLPLHRPQPARAPRPRRRRRWARSL